ncbi:hypothetical protein [Paraburkholderia adhaesiva]|uniref:hypothetical protein n=1 Tax=Paraburkholderia adhaesiva TaxID=2883244 RepID=UPI001F359A97|nr:hypothetical protein [Paraburkholderia adhaesiva]
MTHSLALSTASERNDVIDDGLRFASEQGTETTRLHVDAKIVDPVELPTVYGIFVDNLLKVRGGLIAAMSLCIDGDIGWYLDHLILKIFHISLHGCSIGCHFGDDAACW